MAKAGRPRTYKPEYCEIMYKLMQEGALDCEVFTALKISKDTFYRWLNEYPEFKEAHDLGLAECQTWWTIKGRERFLQADDKGFKYWIAIMNNKFSWEKGTKGEGTTTNINIGNMNVLQQMSRESLLKEIQLKLPTLQEELGIELIEAPKDNDKT